MYSLQKQLSITLVILFNLCSYSLSEYCSKSDPSCNIEAEDLKSLYTKESNSWDTKIHKYINSAINLYTPCKKANCSCHMPVMEKDLAAFDDGITKEEFNLARSKGTKYQIINGKLYREKDCHFPARCSGIEYYIKKLAEDLPDMDLSINTRDWPQINMAWKHPKAPVFSFSKTRDYYDIMYPAWSFWEGGPAISLYPTGIGRWGKHRELIADASKKWSWDVKKSKAFFRGSRTSAERDALILLSRSEPHIVDAQYTKNQAWKSDADTLQAEPASEVRFEDHCKYKYLFNYRGVAASFRFKHLFLCKSLVFHVGDEWLEFFYPSLKPWVHYIPVASNASQEELKNIIEFFKRHDDIAKEIAQRGSEHIWKHLTDKDVTCYWKNLLSRYAELLRYDVVKDKDLIRV